MNLATMLMQTVTPLADYKPMGKLSIRDTRVKITAQHLRNTTNANAQKHAETKAKYREAWQGQEWATTSQLESRMGMARASAGPTLRDWMKIGLLERRPTGGGVFNRRKGWEWRWVK